MSKRQAFGVASALAVLGACGWVVAQEAALPLRVDRVALFKNGIGYISASGELPAGARTVVLGDMPIPSLGTFWVGYPSNLAVRGIVGSVEDAGETEPARSVPMMLAANIGRDVKIVFANGEVAEGRIESVSRQEQPDRGASPYIAGTRTRPAVYDPFGGSWLVLLKGAQGNTVTFGAQAASRVEFLGSAGVATSVVSTVRRPRIRMDLEQPAKGERVGVSYLARGITWSPSYMIDLTDAKTARLYAKALVINEAADLKGARLELVTGFPNIQFGDIASPIAMATPLADYLNALQSGRNDRRSSRGAMTQQIAFNSFDNGAGFDQGSQPLPAYSTAAAGSVAEDLYLYPAGSIDLKRGETGYVPLFTTDAAYEHIYVWKIADLIDEDDHYRRENPNERRPGEEVWHSCRLTNASKMPWTTAPAEFVKDGQFVGQDICYYTGPGAKTTIRINRAMNVLADQAEFEVSRNRNAANFHGSSYDLVQVRGELKVRSALDRAVSLEVTKDLSGEVKEMTPAAKDAMTARGLRGVNPRHTLTWTIELKAGEEQTLTYVYQVYVRG